MHICHLCIRSTVPGCDDVARQQLFSNTLHDLHRFVCLAYTIEYTTKLAPQPTALPLSYRGMCSVCDILVSIVYSVMLSERSVPDPLTEAVQVVWWFLPLVEIIDNSLRSGFTTSHSTTELPRNIKLFPCVSKSEWIQTSFGRSEADLLTEAILKY